MISRQYDYDPSDLTTGTIKELFFRQMKCLSTGTCSVEQKMNTFDRQFSDSWF
ncbi:hypothetical protein KY362_05475 [Candidatus Woesearchaeota archaeon]|nr:hypothetical protein [Candidatus Woesearchaeota archaeon]